MGEAFAVKSLYVGKEHAPSGAYRIRSGTPGGHPADGMTIDVSMGGGAVMSMINPLSFEDGGPEWVCRYGDIKAIRYTVAGYLESYDYLLSEAITTKEATRRLRILRSARRTALRKQEEREEPR